MKLCIVGKYCILYVHSMLNQKLGLRVVYRETEREKIRFINVLQSSSASYCIKVCLSLINDIQVPDRSKTLL